LNAFDFRSLPFSLSLPFYSFLFFGLQNLSDDTKKRSNSEPATPTGTTPPKSGMRPAESPHTPEPPKAVKAQKPRTPRTSESGHMRPQSEDILAAAVAAAGNPKFMINIASSLFFFFFSPSLSSLIQIAASNLETRKKLPFQGSPHAIMTWMQRMSLSLRKRQRGERKRSQHQRIS